MTRLDLGIGARLALGFGVVLAIVVVTLGSTFAWYHQLERLQRHQAEGMELSRGAAALEVAVLDRAVATRRFAITRSVEHFDAAAAAAQEARRALSELERRGAVPGRGAEDAAVLLESFLVSGDRFLERVKDGADATALLQPEAEMTTRRDRLAAAVKRLEGTIEAELGRASASASAAREALVLRTILAAVLALLAAASVATLTTRAVRTPATELVSAARALADGDHGPALALAPPAPAAPGPRPAVRDELRELARTFASAAAALKERERRLSSDARLSRALAATIEPESIARDALSEVVGYAGAELGAVYLADEGSLRPIATFALPAEAAGRGEGLPAQVVVSGTTLRVNAIPAETPFRVRFGFDEVPPRSLVATPLPFQGRTMGVLLVGSVRELGDAAAEFVEAAAPRLAIALQSALAHRRAVHLAAELQDRNERLQAQNEEIQSQSEELQAQSEELQAQSEEIQAQNEELLAQNEELNRSGAELRRGREELARVDQLKDEFLAALSHELRNPLASISAAVQQLDCADAERGGKRRATIAHQTRRLARIVDDLLDVTRINKNKLELRRAPVDAARIVADAVDAAAHAFAGAGVELVATTGEPVPVHADAARLEQVVENLLSNAQKFTPPGGRVQVSVEREETDAVIRVRDDGIGMPPDVRARVFDLFFQGARAAGRHQNGLGVGLSLVKRIVEMHGGTVTCASEPGAGTEFTVRLPAAPPGTEVTAAPVRPGRRDARPLRVLVVEDNDDFAFLLEDALTGWGHAVTLVHRGEEGLALAAAGGYDVILLDVGLPDLDGYEVARRIRQAAPAPRAPIVAMTGYGRPEDAARAAEAGFDVHLVKPVDLDRVEALLAELGARGASLARG
ncbi:hybrid sensor histidine kinase/response regulator [Anaeromyxobacter sp. SG26]|uniref:hybrid sensor histidine kinase/response regulator n=1 Tax=Anaeromyxobacter sp. SG26 TaxID=2925407 RepID=UPI001F586B77|nr:ATP-binding protein [Anaeromyxobacter sp. SG26]